MEGIDEIYKSSAGMPSEPALLLFLSLWIALRTSSVVGGGTSSLELKTSVSS